jgi:multiple antibiotic resistance protein
MIAQSKKRGADIAFTPLAMPSISGPGAIAATISLTSFVKNWLDWLSILVGLFSLAVICYYTLVSSSQILKWIGPNGLEVFRKIMGFLILCIGVQFVVNGVVGFLSDPQIMQPIMKALSGKDAHF